MRYMFGCWALGLVMAVVAMAACDSGGPSVVVTKGWPPVTPLPTSTPTPTLTQVPTIKTPTLTVEEALWNFISCDRLRATKTLMWGQAPGVIYSGDPRITGNIEPNDYARFLMSEPTNDGVIRIKVYPHDGRAVGASNDQVWIDWAGLVRSSLESHMFSCED